MHLSIYSLTYSDNSIYSCIYKKCMYNQNQIETDREGSLTSTISPGFAHGGYYSRDNQNVHELYSFLEFKGILFSWNYVKCASKFQDNQRKTFPSID